MALNLHQLRLFAAIVDEGSFTKAASALGLTQPAISRAVNDLESRLNLSLLDRSNRSVTVTEAGRLLYGRAKELFGVERTLERELRELRGGKRGALRVAASPMASTYVLPPILGRFQRRHPGVKLVLRHASAYSAVKLLLNCRVDVAIVDEITSSPDIETIAWRDDDLVVIASPDHPAAGHPTTAADLVAHTLVTGGNHSKPRIVLDRALAKHGVRFERLMRVRGTEGMKQAVAAGLGIAVVSRAAIEDQVVAGRLVVVLVTDLQMRCTLSILQRRGRAMPAAARELRVLLDEHRTPDAGGIDGAS